MTKSSITVETADLFSQAGMYREPCLQMASAAGGDVGLSYEWMEGLWRAHFGSDTPLTVILRDEHEEVVGLVPMFRRRRSRMRLPVRQLLPLSTLYSTRGGLALSAGTATVEALLDALEQVGEWDSFELHVERGSALDRLLCEAANANGYRISRARYESAPFTTLDGTFEDYLSEKSGNFRSNLRRKTKKLHNKFSYTIKIYTSPEEAEKAVQEIIDIDKNSWKEKEGTAISSRNETEALYKNLAKNLSKSEWLRIYIMYIDSKPIAFDYGVLFHNNYFMLKTSYIESMSDYSPGIVLRGKVLEDLFEIGAKEHDFMWGVEHYKMQWSNGIREYDRLTMYNKNLRAHSIHLLDRLGKRR